MNKKLSKEKCIPCEGNIKSLQNLQLLSYMDGAKKWLLIDRKKIEREVVLKNFKEALHFVNKVGKIAEDQGHHPEIYLHSFKKVKLTLYTHAINGLSKNDFIIAAKIDELVKLVKKGP